MRALLLLCLSLFPACTVLPTAPVAQRNLPVLTGRVITSASFKVQSWQDLVQSTAVSLVYPPGHPQAHQTLMTGLTDASGQFTLQDPAFAPDPELVYVLEAARRVQEGPHDALALSTYVRWTGTVWESITGTAIAITPLTTTLTIMSDLNPALLPSATLNTVSDGVPTPLGDMTIETLTDLQAYVLTLLDAGYDPTTYLRFDVPSGRYSVVRPNNLPAQALRDLGHCPRCDLQASNLRNLTAPGANLAAANLRDADLQGAVLTGADLSAADLRNSNLRQADLTGATLTQARLDGAQWTDGRICADNSWGACQ
jgi:hypothetical protein